MRSVGLTFGGVCFWIVGSGGIGVSARRGKGDLTWRKMVKLIVVGKMKNRELAALCADYFARLLRFGNFECVELKDANLEAEAGRISDALKGFKGRIYALCEEGKLKTSVELSKMLEADLLRGGSAFIIGSAYGLSPKIKERADVLLSLSPLTFTHEFARAILAEQLYRAKTITANTGYHHV